MTFKEEVKECFDDMINRYDNEEEWTSSHNCEDVIVELESTLRDLVSDLKFNKKELKL